MGEPQNSQAYIDLEYAAVFNSIGETSNGEAERARQLAGAGLSPIHRAKSDHDVTIDVIHSKISEYRAHTEGAYSLYGHNPFFLMKDLSFKRIRDSLDSSPPDVSVAYTAIDRAYRGAMELRRLSWVIAIIASQLPELAARRSHIEAANPAGSETRKQLSMERLAVVNLETNILFLALSDFLVERVVAAADSTGGSLSKALINYKIAVDNISAAEQAAVRPYAFANPGINSPLSKPELEALNNLVYLQTNSQLGKRWQDYHASLLHSESARHMAAAANTLAGLISRAQEEERLQEQILIAQDLEARKLLEEARAQEEARIAAEAEAEARRLADEQARIATEDVRSAHTFRASGAASAAGPLFMTSAGVIAVAEAAAAGLQVAIRSAIAALSSLAAGVGAGAMVGVSALVYSSKLVMVNCPIGMRSACRSRTLRTLTRQSCTLSRRLAETSISLTVSVQKLTRTDIQKFLSSGRMA